MKQGGFTEDLTKEQSLDRDYKDFCPHGDAHHLIDITTLKDTHRKEICKNCNEMFITPFRF